MIRKVTEKMYLNKAEMAFRIDQVNKEAVPLIEIVFKALGQHGWPDLLVALHSLVSKPSFATCQPWPMFV